jgi:hypothetical protein
MIKDFADNFAEKLNSEGQKWVIHMSMEIEKVFALYNWYKAWFFNLICYFALMKGVLRYLFRTKKEEAWVEIKKNLKVF